MSDIRFNQWLHQSGTGGITQVDGGHVGIGTTNPDVAVHSGNTKKINVGIVTANSIYAGSLYGDGSNLTGITGTTINNNADNRVITGSGSANTLNGESTLTFDGSLLKLQVDSGEFRIESANGVDQLSVDSDNGNTFLNGRLETSSITGPAGNAGNFSIASGHANSPFIFYVGQFGVSANEKLRITSDGKIGINDPTPSVALEVVGHNQVTFGSMPETMITYGTTSAYNSGSAGSGIQFGGYYNSTPEYTIFAGVHGVKENTTNSNYAGNLVFSTRQHGGNSAERLRIHSTGKVTIADGSRTAETSTGGLLIDKDITAESDVSDKNNYHLVVRSQTNSNTSKIGIAFANTSNDEHVGAAILHHRETTDSVGSLAFYTSPSAGTTTERMKIDRYGNVTKPNHCCFEVKLNGDQSFNSASRFKLNFNYVANQQGTTFDTGNNRFTAPVTGYYQFNIGVYSYYSTYMEIDGRCNGASTGAKTYRPTTRYSDGQDRNPGASMMASWVVKLDANDYYEIYCYVVSSSGTRNIYSDINRTPTWWSGYLVC